MIKDLTCLKERVVNIKAKQTIASILAATLVANMSSIPFEFNLIANASSSYSIEYNADDYDVWNGTSYDFEWYKNPSEPNNYVIADADDFAGFLVLSNDYSASSIVLDPADAAFLAQKEDWTGCKITLTSGVNIAGFEESAADFGGEFDLGGKTICSSSNLFATVTTNGKIHNGKFTALNKFDVGGDPVATEVTIVGDNAGVISDIDFSWAESSLNATGCDIVLCGTNTGTIENVTAVYGLIACPIIAKTNDGLINNNKVVLVPETGFVDKTRNNLGHSMIGTNDADIKNFEILATSETADDNSADNLVFINTNKGVIDGFVVNDVTFWCYTCFGFIYANAATGVIKNADVIVTIKTPTADGNISAWAVFTYEQVGVIEDSKFDVTLSPTKSCFFGSGTYRGFTNNGSIPVSYMDSQIIRGCEITLNFLESNIIPNNYGGLLGARVVYDCDVKITGSKNTFASSSAGSPLGCNLKDCTLDIDYLTYGNSSTEGNIFQGMVENCTVRIGEIYGQNFPSQFVSLLDSDVTIDKISNVAGDYPLVAYLTKNSNVTIKNATGKLSDLVGGAVIDSCYNITYGGDFKVYGGGNYGPNTHYYVQNSELYYFFADDAVGTFNTLFDQYDLGSEYGRYSNMASSVCDTLIYIGDMPNSVTTPAPVLMGGTVVEVSAAPFWTGWTGSSSKGITLIAPHVNVDAVKGLSGGFSIFAGNLQSGGSMIPPNDCYFDVNLYFVDTDNINYVSVLRPDYGMPNNLSKNNVFNINVFDSTGVPLNIPVYGYTTNNPQPLNFDVQNTILRSNTKSPQSAMIAFNEDSAGQWAWWLQQHNINITNCALDLPNAQLIDEKPGFVNVQTYTSYAPRDDSIDKVLCGIAQSFGLFDLTGCYVPEGQSGVYRRISDTDDKLNTYTALQAVYNSADSNNTKDMAVYLVDTLGLSFTSEDDAVFTTTTFSANGDTTGELAYLLDKGADWDTRTFDWTVADESYAIKNVLTDEVLWEFPHKTIHNKLDTSASYFEDYMNDNPVFKASVADVEHGSITLAGLGNTMTNETSDFIYNKEDSYVVADEQVDAGYVMTVVTEKQGANDATDLPSISRTYALNDYTISGYVLPHSDVLLSPVFTPFYTVTANLTNATVTISKTEAFENDIINIDVTPDVGYEISDLKWNDNLFPTPYENLSFTMPASNVVITANVSLINTPAPNPPSRPSTPSREPRYFVDREVVGEGALTTSHFYTYEGTTVEVYTTPSEGYRLVSLTVDGKKIDESNSFIMPSHDVTVRAVFETTGEKPEIPTDPVFSKDCCIEFFSVAGFEGIIDDDANTISLSIPDSEKESLTSIVPDKIIWKGNRLSPDETASIDLTNVVEYTVYAEDPTVSKTYVIKVDWVPDDIPEIPLDENCAIEYYSVKGYVADINQRLGLIQLNIPEKEKSSFVDIIPEMISWIGSELTPSETMSVDLTNDLEYTVYAEDKTISKTYIVKVNWIADNPGENPDTGDVSTWNVVRCIFLIIILGGTVTFVTRRKKQY